MSYQVPVLMIVYRRLETTQKVLAALATVKPARVYVACDAPNPANPGDVEKVDKVRALFDILPWECEVIRLFRTEHQSVKKGLSSAITWFFDQVEEGVILEDDCEVDPTFFTLAAECLERYRDNPKVMQIAASNFQFGESRTEDSYYFSRYNHIWGWASWSRAWKHFKLNPEQFDKGKVFTAIDRIFTRPQDRSYWKAMYAYAMSGKINTWDFQWMFSFWEAGGYSITPNSNLISNLGFGSDATNSISANSRIANLAREPLSLPLRHPKEIVYNDRADEYTSDEFFGVSQSAKSGHLKVRVATMLPVEFKKRVKKTLLKLKNRS